MSSAPEAEIEAMVLLAEIMAALLAAPDAFQSALSVSAVEIYLDRVCCVASREWTRGISQLVTFCSLHAVVSLDAGV